MAIHAAALMKRGHTVLIVASAPKPTRLRDRIRRLLKGEWPRRVVLKSHLEQSGISHYCTDKPCVTDADVPSADVIVATWWETAEWVNQMAASKGAKVYFIQGHEVFPGLPIERCKATYKYLFHKIVVSSWLQRLMVERYGDDKTDLVPNAFEHAQFFAEPRGKQSRPTIGFLYSAAHNIKGIDVALRAINSLREMVPNLRVVSFGSQVPPRGLLPVGVEFTYSPPQLELRKFYAQCDVWLSASRSEGFNLTAMEAMACRTPVVATKTGWPVVGFSNGENGYLVEINDHAGLARAVLKVLSLDESAWRRLSENAYAAVAESSWERSADMFEAALYNACCRSRAAEIAGECPAVLEGDRTLA
jgi:glycosyltransferase involved in cell wall biosynthesis